MNGKGGVGKSFFAVNLVQFLKDHKIHHHAIDTDDTNSTLKRFHPDAAFADLSDAQELDSIFHAIESYELVVVDCRAASTNILFDYFENIGVGEVLMKLDAALTVVVPINHEADSLDQLQLIVEQLGTRSRYLVLRNESHSRSFTIYERSQVRERLRRDLGGREITMAKLEDWLVAAMSHLSLTPSQTHNHRDFHLLDRQRIVIWQRKLYAEIESAKDHLLPWANPTVSADEKG